uniref:Uncharacterized protein n=1 Tax=Nelumbo nucifera TaxID=4432 RepID=A0A822YR94_NELNU|nr:TPA_asm: hypothetical protein HUJ06_005303 [Nelumbo nucifera]
MQTETQTPKEENKGTGEQSRGKISNGRHWS